MTCDFPKVALGVALVEDDRELRAHWREEIDAMTGYRCVAECGSAEEALVEIPAQAPRLVLMDIHLPGKSGIECIRELMACVPNLAIVVLTAFADRDALFAALQAGACGYLLKRASSEMLREALEQAVNGGAPMSPQIARQLVEFFHRQSKTSAVPLEVETLSVREADVLRLLARGLPYKLIADQLDITLNSVRCYIRRAYQKLHVNSRTEAVVKYLNQDGVQRP